MRRAAAWIATEWSRSDRLLVIGTALVALVVAGFALDLWGRDLTSPLYYFGDSLPIAAHFKTAAETGWYEFQRLLGAPAGQTYHDFPTADNLHFLAAVVLGWLTGGQWPLAVNLYLLVGFPLAAATAVWFFRKVGMSAGIALALAVLFAIAPYHFQRSVPHLWLASYYTVPLAMFLVIEVLRGNPLLRRRSDRTGWRRLLTIENARTLAIVLITGSAQSYYAVFFLTLLGVAGLYRLAVSRHWPSFWAAAGTGVATAAVMIANMAPDVLYRLANGPNPIGFERSPVESELFALKLMQLILPWPGHRIGPLREIRELYDASYPLMSEQPALGTIAAIGLVILLLVVGYTAAASGRARPSTPRTAVLAGLGLLVFVAFLFSTVGGISTFISFLTDALRGWNRMVIVIALFALAAVGVVIDGVLLRAVRRARKPGRRFRVLAALTAAALLVVGYIDQTPVDATAQYDAAGERFAADRAWFGEIEERLPDDALVLQLPYQGFPEGLSPLGVFTSESLIPYLQTTTIRWSGGGIKGRPDADWPMMIERLDPVDIAVLASAAGVDGIHVDRRDLTPVRRDELDAGLRAIPGVEVIVRDDGTAAFYDLRALSTLPEDLEVGPGLAAAAGAATVDPITARGNADIAQTVAVDGSAVIWRYAAADATLPPSLVLVSDRAEATTIELRVAIVGTSDGSAAIALPDGRSVPVATDGTPTSVTLSLAPGTTELPITGTTGDLDIVELTALDDAQLQYLDAVRERLGAGVAW